MSKIIDKISLFYLIVILLSCVVIFFITLLILVNKSENIPIVILTGLTGLFSALAYFFSRQRFRLDLLDKRWSVYQAALKFCSIVSTYGGIPSPQKFPKDHKNLMEAVYTSFRGTGYHKTMSLFGEDIQGYFTRLNKVFGYLVTNREYSNDKDDEKAERKAKEISENLNFVLQTVVKLPEIFRPYVYFGNYKNRVEWGL